jgi:hypothetical protein
MIVAGHQYPRAFKAAESMSCHLRKFLPHFCGADAVYYGVLNEDDVVPKLV